MKNLCSKTKNPPASSFLAVGRKLFEAKIKTSRAQPPRARRHTRTVHTAEAKLRVLLGETQHFITIQKKRGFGNRTRSVRTRCDWLDIGLRLQSLPTRAPVAQLDRASAFQADADSI